MKEVLSVMLDDYADWEAVPLAAAINQSEGFCVRTVSLTRESVISIGGFSVNPDYDLPEAVSGKVAGLVLAGGNPWRTKEAEQVAKLVRLAITKNAVVAAIRNASVYLGAMGVLNEIEYTSNQLEYLQSHAGERYTGACNYKNQQAVRSVDFVTVNGTASYGFAREVLYVLDVMLSENVEQCYRFYKLGYYEALKG